MPDGARPGFPASYDISTSRDGLLDWEFAESRLRDAHNYWVCTTSADGAPHARPVWAVWMAGRLCFSTDPGSAKGRNLARDPRLTVHLESGAEVVILEGLAEPLPAELAEELAEAYERKYDQPVSVGDSGWYAVAPRRVYAWAEASYRESVTRFRFD